MMPEVFGIGNEIILFLFPAEDPGNPPLKVA